MRKKLLRSRSGFEKPESREEAIMQNILGASNVLEPSESNIEEILKSILYNTPYTKEAEFEIEKILLAIKNNGTYDGECESRDLKILFAILNDLDYTEEAESRIEELFIEWLNQRSKVKVLEGIPPLTFIAKGEPLINYEISGNTIQSGTPTPDNPIMPQGTGERTGNLIDVQPFTTEASESSTYFSLWSGTLPVGDYTLSLNQDDTLTSSVRNCIRITIGGVFYYEKSIENYHNNSGIHTMPFTISEPTQAVEISYWTNNLSNRCTYSNIMLNLGSEALPYEPYGYKIPILSASTTTNVYLGEVQTTRKIKKYECTGDENWRFYSDSAGEYGAWQFYVDNAANGLQQSSALSNIADYGATATTRSRYPYGVYLVTSGTGIAFQMAGAKDIFPNVAAWKSYLQQQYTAGTPVTVWCVLATPETAVVNEPLMKIGDYADTLSMEQAGVQIPTNNGTTVIDVDTTVKPSNIYIEYK